MIVKMINSRNQKKNGTVNELSEYRRNIFQHVEVKFALDFSFDFSQASLPHCLYCQHKNVHRIGSQGLWFFIGPLPHIKVVNREMALFIPRALQNNKVKYA